MDAIVFIVVVGGIAFVAYKKSPKFAALVDGIFGKFRG